MDSFEALLSYIPRDRRVAILTGQDLPARTEGVALWADLSGFTPLTETLVTKLGPRHGAEELALCLDNIYNALIAPVEACDGSVIDFSGDAITCWFDADDGQRAIAAAHAMQRAVKSFENLELRTGEIISLGVKIAIAHGPVRRFRVGDPSIRYLDTLAGATVDNLAAVGTLARTGEILLEEVLATGQDVREWRSDPETGRRAAVLTQSDDLSMPVCADSIDCSALSEEHIRPWLLPEVFAYIQSGQGEFLTELCPAVALFIYFEGLNYDDEQAGDKLDTLVCHVQRILAEYDGTLLQLTIDNKGSYMYAAFGAPVAHEDDIARAAAAALKLRSLPQEVEHIESVCMGLSKGLMRTGGYGGATRRTYGVLGENVNLAARLMQHADPGQILVSESIWQECSDFHWEHLPEVQLKGLHTVVVPAQLLGWYEQNMLDLPEATAAFPMIGRRSEMALLEEKLALVRQGKGQIVSIMGDAGLGKSRLLAEILQRTSDLVCYGGECQSYGMHSAYLVWQPVWRTFFGLDPAASSADQLRGMEQALAHINPEFVQRLPLLDAVINISIPDNALTSGVDAKMRKTLRESLLVDCLCYRAAQAPIVLVLEDLHWSDSLSLNLLEAIGQAIAALPVLILLAYRPPVESEMDGFLPSLAKLSHYSELHLVELTLPETEQLIASRFRNFGLDAMVPASLIKRLSARAQGNPFYIEELLNYQHARGLDLRDDSIWDQGDLPESLHSLILSRIDQLTERQQITIKAASIIGRLFLARWLYEYYPSLGATQVVEDLNILNRLDLLVQDAPEPQLSYLFKHVITQEVAYENLAYATRANLHEQFASYMENVAGDDDYPYLDLLAYHYELSDNLPKKRAYLRKAGEAAQAAFANEAALSYFARALSLAPETDYNERFELISSREKILNILGRRDDQNQNLTILAEIAEALDDNKRRAQVAVARSKYARAINDYSLMSTAAQQAVTLGHQANADEYEASAYWLWGDALFFQGEYEEARSYYEKALVLAEGANLVNLTANILVGLGSLDNSVSNYDRAEASLKRALSLQHEANDRIGETLVLSGLGDNAYFRGDFAKAQVYYEQTLQTWHSIGYKQTEGRTLGRIGSLLIQQADFEQARFHFEQALRLSQEAHDSTGEMISYYNFSVIDLAQNNYLSARKQIEHSLRICKEINYKYYEGGCLTHLGSVADELGEYPLAVEYHQQAVAILNEIGDRHVLIQAITSLGMVFYHLSLYERAWECAEQALSIAIETDDKFVQNRALTLQGHLFREQANLDKAADSYQQALVLAQELNVAHFAKQAQAGLASVAFVRDDLDRAKDLLDELLSHLQGQSLSTNDEIFWIYLVCYRILVATSDPRAWSVLEAAYARLQGIATRIDDESLRVSFLQNVRFNREIIEVWEMQSKMG